MEKYLMTPPFNRRPVTINTLCVVGACTCIMIKMAVEKAFKTLGISELDIDVHEQIRAVIEKKYRNLSDEKVKRRAVAALQRLGYRWDDIKSVLSEYNEDETDEF